MYQVLQLHSVNLIELHLKIRNIACVFFGYCFMKVRGKIPRCHESRMTIFEDNQVYLALDNS